LNVRDAQRGYSHSRSPYDGGFRSQRPAAGQVSFMIPGWRRKARILLADWLANWIQVTDFNSLFHRNYLILLVPVAGVEPPTDYKSVPF
jgi:hypothetical protein